MGRDVSSAGQLVNILWLAVGIAIGLMLARLDTRETPADRLWREPIWQPHDSKESQ
jgi:hypothetical protein